MWSKKDARYTPCYKLPRQTSLVYILHPLRDFLFNSLYIGVASKCLVESITQILNWIHLLGHLLYHSLHVGVDAKCVIESLFQILNKISNEVRALLVGIIFPLCIFIDLDFWGLNAIRAHATVFFRGFQYPSGLNMMVRSSMKPLHGGCLTLLVLFFVLWFFSLSPDFITMFIPKLLTKYNQPQCSLQFLPCYNELVRCISQVGPIDITSSEVLR